VCNVASSAGESGWHRRTGVRYVGRGRRNNNCLSGNDCARTRVKTENGEETASRRERRRSINGGDAYTRQRGGGQTRVTRSVSLRLVLRDSFSVTGYVDRKTFSRVCKTWRRRDGGQRAKTDAAVRVCNVPEVRLGDRRRRMYSRTRVFAVETSTYLCVRHVRSLKYWRFPASPGESDGARAFLRSTDFLVRLPPAPRCYRRRFRSPSKHNVPKTRVTSPDFWRRQWCVRVCVCCVRSTCSRGDRRVPLLRV